MNEIIYKYSLALGKNGISLPDESVILTAQVQEPGELKMWARTPMQTVTNKIRYVWVIGTGQILPLKKLRYINTTQDGVYVWHIFEEIQ